MKTDELIKSLQSLKVQTGSLACLGCGHEHNCGVHGCAIAREAAVRLSLYEHALEQVAKERDTLLAQLRRLGGCMGCIGHMNSEARLCTDCDETFCAWHHMTDRELNLLRELLETLERDEGACYKDRSHCTPACPLWMAGEFGGNICLPSILARRVKRLTFGKALPTTKGENNHESNS